MRPLLIPVAALLLGLSASAAFANTGVVLRNEKLYSQPSATASAAGSAVKGASVTILAKQGGWLRVTAGKTTGWIRLLSVRAGAGGLGGAGVGDVIGAATTQSNPSKVVAVAGLRGLSDEELKQAKYNADEIARLDALAVSGAQAQSFAAQSGLAVVNVPALPKPQTASSSGNTTSPWGEN